MFEEVFKFWSPTFKKMYYGIDRSFVGEDGWRYDTPVALPATGFRDKNGKMIYLKDYVVYKGVSSLVLYKDNAYRVHITSQGKYPLLSNIHKECTVGRNLCALARATLEEVRNEGYIDLDV